MLLRLGFMLFVMAALFVYNAYFQPPHAPDAESPQQASESPRATPVADSLVVTGLALRDERGRVINRGDVDLTPTLERIAENRRLRFPHDGSIFQNREKRLPRQPAGYYREWVVPTPGEQGPGPQRIVTGKAGEVWYTSDHYRSFRRIPYTWPDS
jgi:filamentous hemagglutinin